MSAHPSERSLHLNAFFCVSELRPSTSPSVQQVSLLYQAQFSSSRCPAVSTPPIYTRSPLLAPFLQHILPRQQEHSTGAQGQQECGLAFYVGLVFGCLMRCLLISDVSQMISQMDLRSFLRPTCNLPQIRNRLLLMLVDTDGS